MKSPFDLLPIITGRTECEMPLWLPQVPDESCRSRNASAFRPIAGHRTENRRAPHPHASLSGFLELHNVEGIAPGVPETLA
jgi:hypothetical protein